MNMSKAMFVSRFLLEIVNGWGAQCTIWEKTQVEGFVPYSIENWYTPVGWNRGARLFFKNGKKEWYIDFSPIIQDSEPGREQYEVTGPGMKGLGTLTGYCLNEIQKRMRAIGHDI